MTIKLSDLNQHQTEKVTFKNWIELEIKKRFTLKEQQSFMKIMNDNKGNEIEHVLDVVIWLIASWNVWGDDDQILPITLEVFSSLPLTINDLNNIIEISGVFALNIDEQKKNTSEI